MGGKNKKRVIITLIEPDVPWPIISKRFHLYRAQSHRVRNDGVYIEKEDASYSEVFINKLYATGVLTGGDPLGIESLGI